MSLNFNSAMSGVHLRDVQEDDLPIFFEHQIDPEATAMADFPSRDWATFMAHWARILSEEANYKQTILFNGQVAGNIVSWNQSGDQLVGYWLGKEFWGKGIATKALSLLLIQIKTRPLYAHVVKHNIASRRVLEKCGFVISAEVVDPEDPKVEEFILKLS